VKGATHTKDPSRHFADSALAGEVREICAREGLSLKSVEQWMGGPTNWLCIWMLGTTSLGPLRRARVQKFLAAYRDASLPVDDLKARQGRKLVS
jgi:hypothetical protein